MYNKLSVSEGKLVDAFGYNPLTAPPYMGSLKSRAGITYDFYFKEDTGAIEVCHENCNGTYYRGILQGNETGLPEDVQDTFFRLKKSLNRRSFIGTIDQYVYYHPDGNVPPSSLHCYIDGEERRFDIFLRGHSRPNRSGYWRGFYKKDCYTIRAMCGLKLEFAFIKLLIKWKSNGKTPQTIDYQNLEELLTPKQYKELHRWDY